MKREETLIIKENTGRNWKAFFEELCKEAVSIEMSEEHMKRAVSFLADEVQLGKVEVELNAPPSKLRPNGEYRNTVLYNRGEACSADPYVMKYEMADNEKIRIVIYPWREEVFTRAEQELLQIICQEIFQQLSRITMRGILQHIIETDMATGVANQDALIQTADRLLAENRLQEYRVLFFNIHNFKYVNKVFTYAEGDVVLRNYANQIRGMLKEDEIVARLGGDNFVVLVRNENQESLTEQICNLRLTYVTPFKTKEFIFGATMGISTLENIKIAREVMARASIAYQAARQRGAGSVVFFSPEVQQELMKTQEIISNFLPALEAGEFIVYYQPKVMISERKICGAEALVRWVRDGQVIPPAQFLPQLEREGSICKLDYYVLEMTCRFIRDRLGRGKESPCISVNFSRRHLDEDDMVERIVEIIERYGIDHSYIEIELTESEDFQNYEIMSRIVNGLKQYGIGTSIDDFGTGFSSLNMIKKVDLNVIKIDKSFIPLEWEYPEKEKDKIMFGNIVGLVRQLGKKTIAEGVETQEQLEYLKEAGCDIVQGYVFDRPLPEAAFEERLTKGYA